MATGTILTVFLVPVFFVVVRRFARARVAAGPVPETA